jgi:hypothetical protein
MGWRRRRGSIEKVARNGTEGLRGAHKALKIAIGSEQGWAPGSEARAQ